MSAVDERAIGETVGKLVEGKTKDAAALLTNVLVTAATAPLLGPWALGAGKTAESVVNALAARISDSAIRRMVDAGQRLDETRASTLALQQAVQESLGAMALHQAEAIKEVGAQGDEQFIQLLRYIHQNVVVPLERMSRHQAQGATVVSQHERQFAPDSSGQRLLIYVSSGGTCRDPMAKVITERLLEVHEPPFPIRVEACGLGPLSGREASLGARMAISNVYGTDLLAGHKTTLLDEALVARADLILVMSLTLLKVLPREAGGKSFLLKDFLGASGDLKDPWNLTGSPSAEYEQCCDEILRLLSAGLHRIVTFLAYRFEES